jgi:hypothetical protein
MKLLKNQIKQIGLCAIILGMGACTKHYSNAISGDQRVTRNSDKKFIDCTADLPETTGLFCNDITITDASGNVVVIRVVAPTQAKLADASEADQYKLTVYSDDAVSIGGTEADDLNTAEAVNANSVKIFIKSVNLDRSTTSWSILNSGGRAARSNAGDKMFYFPKHMHHGRVLFTGGSFANVITPVNIKWKKTACMTIFCANNLISTSALGAVGNFSDGYYSGNYLIADITAQNVYYKANSWDIWILKP